MKNSKIKLLTIATTRFELDGITNVILNYYRSMDKSDMQIDFVVPNQVKDELRNEIESEGSKIYTISNRIKNPLSYMKKLREIIRNNHYDIVHAHGNSHTLALEMYTAKKCGVTVRIPHSHSTSCKYKLAHKILTPLFFSSYTHGFACGQEAGEWLYEGKPFQIINNGISLEKFKFDNNTRNEYRRKFNLEGHKVIGHIGAFNLTKNQGFLVDIFHELYKLDKSYKLMLVGNGNLRPDVEAKVKELGLENAVLFMGKRWDVPQLMQAMDMIVMPSLHEGLPLTLVEAQTACLPCYVSDAITTEVNITGLVNFISLNESPISWAQKIHNGFRIFNREEDRETILKKIINAGYSITDNAKILKEFYLEFLDENKTSY